MHFFFWTKDASFWKELLALISTQIEAFFLSLFPPFEDANYKNGGEGRGESLYRNSLGGGRGGGGGKDVAGRAIETVIILLLFFFFSYQEICKMFWGQAWNLADGSHCLSRNSSRFLGSHWFRRGEAGAAGKHLGRILVGFVLVRFEFPITLFFLFFYYRV